MSNIRGYEQTFNQNDIGLGIGGNPQDQTLQSDPLETSKDNQGVTIQPPQAPQPKQLTQQDLLTMMTNKE